MKTFSVKFIIFFLLLQTHGCLVTQVACRSQVRGVCTTPWEIWKGSWTFQVNTTQWAWSSCSEAPWYSSEGIMDRAPHGGYDFDALCHKVAFRWQEDAPSSLPWWSLFLQYPEKWEDSYQCISRHQIKCHRLVKQLKWAGSHPHLMAWSSDPFIFF